MEPKAFRWWWPQSTVGGVAITLVLALAALTVVLDPMMFWINVVVWYFVAIGFRAAYICWVQPRLGQRPRRSGADQGVGNFRQGRNHGSGLPPLQGATPARECARSPSRPWIVACGALGVCCLGLAIALVSQLQEIDSARRQLGSLRYALSEATRQLAPIRSDSKSGETDRVGKNAHGQSALPTRDSSEAGNSSTGIPPGLYRGTMSGSQTIKGAGVSKSEVLTNPTYYEVVDSDGSPLWQPGNIVVREGLQIERETGSELSGPTIIETVRSGNGVVIFEYSSRGSYTSHGAEYELEGRWTYRYQPSTGVLAVAHEFTSRVHMHDLVIVTSVQQSGDLRR